jgi:hypothetical protein
MPPSGSLDDPDRNTAERSMRALCPWLAMALSVVTGPAAAESLWVESARLDVSEVRDLCERVSGIRLLARMQMIATGDERWRRLSRQELAVETTIMGAVPLDPGRCYVIARAGPAEDGERRAFEVRDFAVSSERTAVLVVGRAYAQPPDN